MPFEYGTLDTQTVLGMVRSIHRLITENQGFHYGYDSSWIESEVKDDFLEMFYPSSIFWKWSTIGDTRDIFYDSITQFQDLDI